MFKCFIKCQKNEKPRAKNTYSPMPMDSASECLLGDLVKPNGSRLSPSSSKSSFSIFTFKTFFRDIKKFERAMAPTLTGLLFIQKSSKKTFEKSLKKQQFLIIFKSSPTKLGKFLNFFFQFSDVIFQYFLRPFFVFS